MEEPCLQWLLYIDMQAKVNHIAGTDDIFVYVLVNDNLILIFTTIIIILSNEFLK